ncbi:MAG: hypothetical protein IJC63_03210 [Myxococcaceae bacterium]|nr:hypothetical protein [Myxococcaceae bacterium]
MRRSRIVSVGASLPGKRLWGNGSLSHAVRAGREALKQSSYAPRDVELFINAGVHRDEHYAEPAFACFIQEKLGINVEFQARQTASFDLINGACGVLSALDVADCMIQAGQVEVAMIVASESNTDRDPVPEYVTPRSGAAILIDASPEARVGFGGFAFQSFPEHAGLLETFVDLSVRRGRLHVRRDERFETVAREAVGPVVAGLLEREGVKASDIDLVLPSQLSPEFVGSLGETLGVAQDRVVNLTGRFADPHSPAPLLALDEATRQGRTGTGTRALFVTVGSGLTVGAALYAF